MKNINIYLFYIAITLTSVSCEVPKTNATQEKAPEKSKENESDVSRSQRFCFFMKDSANLNNIKIREISMYLKDARVVGTETGYVISERNGEADKTSWDATFSGYLENNMLKVKQNIEIDGDLQQQSVNWQYIDNQKIVVEGDTLHLVQCASQKGNTLLEQSLMKK